MQSRLNDFVIYTKIDKNYISSYLSKSLRTHVPF